MNSVSQVQYLPAEWVPVSLSSSSSFGCKKKKKSKLCSGKSGTVEHPERVNCRVTTSSPNIDRSDFFQSEQLFSLRYPAFLFQSEQEMKSRPQFSHRWCWLQPSNELPSEAFLCSPCKNYHQPPDPPDNSKIISFTGEVKQEMTILGADVGERRRLAGEKGRIGEEGGGSAQEEQEEMMAGRLRLLRRVGCSQSCADQQALVPCLNCSTAPSL